MDLNAARSKSVKDFLGNLEFAPDAADYTLSWLVFTQKDQGITLSGDERKAYFHCLDNLVGALTKSDLFSRSGVESLLQKSVLLAARSGTGTERLSEGAISSAVNWLRSSLQQSPKSYFVYLPVVGLDPECLPVDVGKLTFLRNAQRNLRVGQGIRCQQVRPR